jgi:glycosyltransferase involved in cell wall biosynthesis
MKKIKVSVITIFLNGGDFLREAIESVLAQTFDNWELLLVDDGSTDQSTGIAKEFAKRFNEKIRYLDHGGHENKGMSASRNLGIAHSYGTYLAFLDADDLWTREKLSRQVALLEANEEADMIYGPALWWYSWTGNAEDEGRDFIQNFETGTDILVRPPRMVPLFLRNQLNLPLPSCLLVKREAVERVGGFEEQFRGMYEDQAFLSKFFLKSPVFISGECWLKYRQHGGACCSQEIMKGRHRQAKSAFLSWLDEYLKRQGREYKQILSVLDRQLWAYRHPFLHRIRSKSIRMAKRVKEKSFGRPRMLGDSRRQDRISPGNR